jgi:ribosomal protein S6
MNDSTVPAIETQEEAISEEMAYECAFHLLPTVADGEVDSVFASLKALIAEHGGVVFDEEMPERFTLAYAIRRVTEGRSQAFTNSWFGWVRFTALPAAIAEITTELDHRSEVLRHLVIKLTREEREHPVRVFEKREESATVPVSEADTEAQGEVSATDLNKSLDQITS